MRARVSTTPFGKSAQTTGSPSTPRLAIRPLFFYLCFGGLLATNVLTLVGFLMAPDIAKLFGNQNETVLTAYEDRIAQLRLEVDRLQSRHYAQAGDINLQLQELAQTQEVLMEQHQYVKQLAEKAAALGIGPDIASAPASAVSTPDPADVPSSPPPGTLGTDGDADAKVAAATASVSKMMVESKLALAALSDETSAKTDEIMGALATVGIKPKLPSPDQTAEGGPLLPPVDGAEGTSLVDDANDVALALDRFKAARDAAALAPVHRPISAASIRVSSIFGNRKDPFTGRLAFHSGIDFAAPEGTTVTSAGAGKVTFVGQMSGYGNAIEITHDGGVVTRYGHLSAFLVKEGEVVSTGSPIGRVGSTGRSTGPHLHFEVRRSDNAVDPARYLNAGKILQKIVAS